MFREGKKKDKAIPRTWSNETVSILYFLQLFFIHSWVANSCVAGLDVANQVCAT